MRKVISNIKKIFTNIFAKTKNVKDIPLPSFLFRKKIFIIIISIFILSIIIGLIVGLLNIKHVDVERENRELLRLYNKDRDLVKRGEAMSSENNTPIDRIPIKNKK